MPPSVITSSPPTTPPQLTMPPSVITSFSTEEALEILKSRSFDNGTTLEMQNSPQRQAFEWLVDSNSLGLVQDDADKLVQRYAMATLYFSANGEGWDGLNIDQFLDETRDECEWQVWDEGSSWWVIPTWYGEFGDLSKIQSCNEQGELEVLAFRNNDLGGTLPEEMGLLSPSVKWFLVGENFLPTELGLLTKLQILRLGNNGFTGTIRSELGQLRLLDVLSPDSNNLHGSVPVQLAQFTSLNRMFLNNNNISNPLPTELGSIGSLDTLHLHLNKLAGSQGAAIILPSVGGTRASQKIVDADDSTDAMDV